jgi:outer membrane protein OmpA-like peptidoglycan-associated protein/outer membrane protein assembly factor BamB
MEKSYFSCVLKILFFLLLFEFFSYSLYGSDWPIYKGNIYFTGNNDEIIVKNNNLKWLFQADEQVYNPIVSDGRIYFVDRLARMYCIDEEFGKLIWKVDVRKISSQFSSFSRAAGKIKYPLIKGNILFISDPIAIYAFDKLTGRVLWARTGMRMEKVKSKGLASRSTLTMVDGIYADPIIHENKIFYGTRNMFISRDIRNGHASWDNRSIKTYSGFPTFYDNLIFTQSMDYQRGRFIIHCLRGEDGKEIWAQQLQKPLKIFPPVVYQRRVYIPSGKNMYCLDLKTGERIWMKEYHNFITSNPSFTDRAILFSIGNSDIAIINPDTGDIIREVKIAPKSSPYYVTIRDQIYVAYNDYRIIKNRKLSYGNMKAVNFTDNTLLWAYTTTFPGSVSQPISSKGIMFLPAGNYLYAIGTEFYSRVVDGGDGYAIAPGKKNLKEDGDRVLPPPRQPVLKHPELKKVETRKMRITVEDRNKGGITAQVEIKKREKGRVVFLRKGTVSTGDIEVPAGDNVELIISSPGYVPKKVMVNSNEKDKKIVLDKIAKGEGFIVENIYFEINKAYLKKGSLDIIDKLVKIMNDNIKLKVEVRGHTDSTGDKDYNQKLSERRADAVIEYMIKNGISPERVRSVGFGQTRPIASNKTKEGRRKNRRTEFFFL